MRQYFLEKNVWVLIEMNIPETLAGHWTEKDAAVKNSFRLLQEHAGISIQSLAVRIRSSVSSLKLGKFLNIPPGSPVLELRRLTHSTEQKPVEYAILHFPGEAYELTATLQAGDWREVKLGSQ